MINMILSIISIAVDFSQRFISSAFIGFSQIHFALAKVCKRKYY